MSSALSKQITTAVFVGVVIGLLAMFVAPIIIPIQYGASARVLVTPRAVPGVDPYTSSKAAERIAQNVAQIISTSEFFNTVISVSLGVDATYFPSDDELARRKLWRQTVEASVVYNSGILQITAYHPDPKQATYIANAVAYVLTKTGNDFAVNAADFRLIDSPVVSKYPERPQFPAIGLIGFLGGTLTTLVYFRVKRAK